ncbi:MAG: hypothetical protein FWF50_04135 [Defluviitaleaceae bacterium]|nr:hypothetical protein [Defluviitaleaceae bacterium]
MALVKVTVFNPFFWKPLLFIIGFIFLFSLFAGILSPFFSMPDADEEEIVSYITYVNQIDNEANSNIRSRANSVDFYRVGSLTNGIFYYEDTSNKITDGMARLHKNINNFFALYMVFFDND